LSWQSPSSRYRAHAGNTRIIIDLVVETPTKYIVGFTAGFKRNSLNVSSRFQLLSII
jgi:hypothetical protein